MDIDRTHELEEQVRQLTRTIDEMRARVGRLEGGAPGIAEDAQRRSRRNFLRMGAAAAAGALGWAAVKVVPAAAATGGYMILGSANSASNPTTLSAANAFEAQDPSFSSTLRDAALPGAETFTGPLQGLGAATAGGTEGLDAFASGDQSFAVWGLTDSGTGVTGEANTGIGLYARGTGRIRQDPQQVAGIPGYSPNTMEQVRDANGALYIHNALGAWRPVNSLRVDSQLGNGHPFKPFRRVDTRNPAGAPRKAAGGTYAFAVAPSGSGDAGVPADAVAVVGNLTAASYTGAGFLTIMPQGVSYNPNVDPSSLNFIVGQGAIANSFVCGVNPANGQIQVYVGGSSSHFIIDITGYIQ